MYVCICNRVNDRQIQKLARQGVSCLDELQERTSLGKGCGCCMLEAEQILEEHCSGPGVNSGNQHSNRETLFPMGGSNFEPAV
ncbi:MAG: (2Fe-2S)-binding protein [bacterium]|nr:(2Fe-2S)-binding protein [bacterium]